MRGWFRGWPQMETRRKNGTSRKERAQRQKIGEESERAREKRRTIEETIKREKGDVLDDLRCCVNSKKALGPKGECRGDRKRYLECNKKFSSNNRKRQRDLCYQGSMGSTDFLLTERKALLKGQRKSGKKKQNERRNSQRRRTRGKNGIIKRNKRFAGRQNYCAGKALTRVLDIKKRGMAQGRRRHQM